MKEEVEENIEETEWKNGETERHKVADGAE